MVKVKAAAPNCTVSPLLTVLLPPVMALHSTMLPPELAVATKKCDTVADQVTVPS